MTDTTNTPTDTSFTIAVIGAGTGGESLCRALSDGDHRIVVFEDALVGGDCPFVACVPSKAMLHDCRTGRGWNDAVSRRDDLVSHLDDTEHAEGLAATGATIVRERARIVGRGEVEAGSTRYRVDHIVVATGAAPVFPDIDGLDPEHPTVWTSRDVLTTATRPDSVVVIGGGVIGAELSDLLAGFGAHVTVLEEAERLSPGMHPDVSAGIADALGRVGVEVVTGAEIERIDCGPDGVVVRRADGPPVSAARLVVATGRAPRLDGIGLESIGVDPAEATVDDAGRLAGASGVWVIGDAAGREQYTHAANHHAEVVADHLTNDHPADDRPAGGSRRVFGDAALPACMFTRPPVMTVGPSWTDLTEDPDVVWAEVDGSTARHATDELGPSFLAVAARRSTGCIVAANGIGARFDEIASAIAIAIDGSVPVHVLARSVQPFPTVSEQLSQAFDDLVRQLRET